MAKSKTITKIQLTDTQRSILKHAVQKTAGRLQWFPDTVKGGARSKLLQGLFNRALITGRDPEWLVTAEGYDALGLPRPGASKSSAKPTAKASETKAETQSVSAKPIESVVPALPVASRTRANSKQAQVIEMLKREAGASVEEISAATGWQAHTVRGFFAGALKKKLGISLTSIKTDGAARTYLIAATEAKESA